LLTAFTTNNHKKEYPYQEELKNIFTLLILLGIRYKRAINKQGDKSWSHKKPMYHFSLQTIMQTKIFDHEQIARAAEIGVGVTSAEQIEIIPASSASLPTREKVLVQLI